jgi:NAD(P)-dependent dehydrogenase (short-subunit alcohol dehydrogenase family)
MNTFEGYRAIVTGGGSGIGFATAEQLLSLGAQVGVLDLAATAPKGTATVTADLADDAAVRRGITDLVHHLGGLDVLVNCAGIGAEGSVADNDDDEWHRVLDIDVVAVARVTRAALPALRESHRASIVNVGSVVATVGLPRRVLYSAAKGAVLALTRAMAADLLADGIRVNVVSPGTTDTPWVGRLLASANDPAAQRTALEQRQPQGRLVAPAEVAAAITYLASPGAASTTGVELVVDGGLSGLRVPSQPRSS